ncbi:MAG: PDZ domain-containing protein [Magnetococcales bacterium]|nr:PDZ domain-containing protein [Magnetococcales bacterium]NGZ26849.1 PDZ domain-containing protein [Magnetococcales bacterium]
MMRLGDGIVGMGFVLVVVLAITTMVHVPDDEQLTVHSQGINTHVKDHPLFGVRHGREPIPLPNTPYPVAMVQPVAGQRVVTPPARAFVPANVQLAEAHWQGLEALPLSAELKLKLKLPMTLKGLLVDEVTMNAARSGMLAGDVLVAVNNRPVVTLEGLLAESQRVQQNNAVMLTVVRQGKGMSFTLQGSPRLGFAQVETAPMILSGDIPPHPYRGACTNCHPIGTTGHMVPDPDGIMLPPPPIYANARSPHRDRGTCRACHTIIQ